MTTADQIMEILDRHDLDFLLTEDGYATLVDELDDLYQESYELGQGKGRVR
jgi:hypothetical protein